MVMGVRRRLIVICSLTLLSAAIEITFWWSSSAQERQAYLMDNLSRLMPIGQPGGLASLNASGALTAPVRVSTGLMVNPNRPDIEIANGGLAGVISSLDERYQHGLSLENIYIPNESLSFGPMVSSGQRGFWASQISYHFGGTSQMGPRGGEVIYVAHDAPSKAVDPSNPNPFNGALWPFYITSVNDGGTASASRGNAYSVNPQCQLAPGATFYSTVECLETDVEVDEGASVLYKFGHAITTIGNDAVHGSEREAAMHIGTVRSSGGWRYGIMLSDYNGGVPIAPGGTILGSDGTVGVVAKGIDLRAFEITDAAFASPGFQVDGAGKVTARDINTSGVGHVAGLRVADTDDVAEPWSRAGLTVTGGPKLLLSGQGILRYKRVGKTVFYQAALQISAVVNNQAPIQVDGFPFRGPAYCILNGLDMASSSPQVTLRILPERAAGQMVLTGNTGSAHEVEVGGVCETD